jgi:uncharacterized protein YxeA
MQKNKITISYAIIIIIIIIIIIMIMIIVVVVIIEYRLLDRAMDQIKLDKGKWKKMRCSSSGYK